MWWPIWVFSPISEAIGKRQPPSMSLRSHSTLTTSMWRLILAFCWRDRGTFSALPICGQAHSNYNEDITELGMNVATAQCGLGETKAAEDALRRVLIYSPDHSAARQELNAIESGHQTCPPRSDGK